MRRHFPRFDKLATQRDLILNEIAIQKISIKKSAPSKDEVLSSAPWFLKFFLRRKIQKLELEFPNDEVTVMDRVMMSMKSNETLLRYQTVKLFKRISAQVEELKNDKLVRDLEPGDQVETNYFDVDFPLYILHVWFVLRRLLHEGESGKMVSEYIVDQMWLTCEIQVLKFKKLGYQVNAEMSTLHQIFYSVIENLDSAIDKNSDSALAGHLYSVFKNDNMTSLKDISDWVRYVRFQMYFLDQMKGDAFLNVQWRFLSMRHPLIERK